MMEDHTTPRAYSIGRVATLLGLSRSTVERRIADGSLAAVRLGGRVLVPEWALARLLRPPGDGEVASGGR